jgi:hypothetical protein
MAGSRIQILVNHDANIVVDTPEAWWSKGDWEHMEAQDGRLSGLADRLVNIIEEACSEAGLEVDIKLAPEGKDIL